MPPDESRVNVVNIKGNAEARDWLHELCQFAGASASRLFDEAITAHAERIGFPKPAPRRIGGRS